jgi:aminomethyltransferase
MKKTPLNSNHKELGAKMVPFGGWDMPVYFSGIIAEHLATRSHAGIFDVSHMGEILVEGEPEDALAFLEKLTCNTVSSLTNGQIQYNVILNEEGGVVDDITLYRISDSKYFICANASNVDSVYSHLTKYKGTYKVTITNDSDQWHQIALQGPKANQILGDYLKMDMDSIGYFRFAFLDFQNEKILVSRTGYTGEDGFEIYTSIPSGLKIWKDLLKDYQSDGLVPVGLGARDTLRMEAKYPLYGHELTADRTPVESGLGWIVKEKPVPYLGMDRILQDKKNGPKQKIIGIKLLEPGVLREDYLLFADGEESIGKITSGTHSPSLKESIGMALVNAEHAIDGKEISVEIRGNRKKAIIHTGKFIQGSVRRN